MMDAILPGPFHRVHRAVSDLESLSARPDRDLERHGADADRDRPPALGHGLDQLFTKIFEHRAGRTGGGLRQDRRELVASQPPQDVRLSCAGAKCIGDSAQQLVTHIVAFQVVDRLEIVEIDVGEREGPTVP